LQNNQSDLAFLQARSQRIGYEVWIDDKTLHFQPLQHRTVSTVQLEFGQNLIEFLPRLSLLNQVPQLEIRGWDWKKQENFVSESTSESVPLMGGTRNGGKASAAAFGAASHQIVNQLPQDKAEADQMAKGQFEEMSLNYITGEGVCVGNSKIRAGSVIQIVGVGKRFSGRYYVTAVTHLLSPDEGYRTEFTVRRTAA
jgi:phage protein D